MPRIPSLLARHGRPATSFVALWLFGIATTILLAALWGRSVASDEATLAESAEAVLASGYVHERVEVWVAQGLAAGAGTSPEALAPLVDEIVASSELDLALEGVVGDLVDAALSPDGAAVRIDPAALLDAVVPVASDTLADAGYEVDAATVAAALDRAPDLVLSDEDLGVVASAAVATRTILTRASLAGAALMALAGAVAVALAEDRVAQLRDLGTRVALSALGFAVFLRVGAWATDPAAGRSPIAAGGSVILGSNGEVPLLVGAGASVLVAVTAAVVAWRRRARSTAHVGDATGELPVLETV